VTARFPGRSERGARLPRFDMASRREVEAQKLKASDKILAKVKYLRGFTGFETLKHRAETTIGEGHMAHYVRQARAQGWRIARTRGLRQMAREDWEAGRQYHTVRVQNASRAWRVRRNNEYRSTGVVRYNGRARRLTPYQVARNERRWRMIRHHHGREYNEE